MALLHTLDFEEGDLTDWNDGTSTLNSGVVDAHADALRSGSYGSRHYVPTGAADKRAFGKYDTGGSYGEAYYKFYFKLDNLTMADGDVFRFAQKGLTGDISPQIDLERDGATYQLVGAAYLTETVAINKTGWNEVIIYIKPETAEDADDGIVKWWVNSSLEQDQSNDKNNYGHTFDSFVLGFRQLVDEGTSGYIYFDDLEFHSSMPSAEDRNISVSECE